MDTKIEIKEEDPLSDDVASQSETEFFVTVKRNSDVLPDVAIKTEIKSEIPFTKHLVKPETVTCSNNCEVDRKTKIEEHTVISEFGLHNVGESHPVMKLGKFNSDHEMYNKIEIKEEPWWLETETSSVHNDTKDGNFPTVKSLRLRTEAVSGASSDKPAFHSADVSGRHTGFYKRRDRPKCDCRKSDITEMPTVEECVHSEQSDKCSDGGQIHIWPLYQKQKCLIHEGKQPYQCETYDESSTKVSHLKTLNFVPEAQKSHQCKTCSKSFSRSGDLKRHNLIHEGKKPYQCKTCDKRFSDPSALKRHTFIHEGKKPHKCKTCDKSFTDLSNLRGHNMIHEGKKLHQCKTCDKSFIQMSRLKEHNLIHEGKKPHQCKICEKSFAQLSNLKTHIRIHDGKKPHQCKTCGKKFTRLSHLKMHNWIHEGKKPHQCKICDKSFIQLSHLKTHNLIHEGKKPHKCKICDKSFTQMSNLKTHTLIHERKK